jgi:hypothetical protein
MTVYSVYEAKRLAENAPFVGKKTVLLVMRPNRPIETISNVGIKVLDELLGTFAPRQIASSDPLPDGSFLPTQM